MANCCAALGWDPLGLGVTGDCFRHLPCSLPGTLVQNAASPQVIVCIGRLSAMRGSDVLRIHGTWGFRSTGHVSVWNRTFKKAGTKMLTHGFVVSAWKGGGESWVSRFYTAALFWFLLCCCQQSVMTKTAEREELIWASGSRGIRGYDGWEVA